MPEVFAIDLFGEDQAHIAFLKAVVARLAYAEGRLVEVMVRSDRGGRARVLSELRDYLLIVRKGAIAEPDLLVVAVDGNCRGFVEAQREVREIAADRAPRMAERLIAATPDPHVERWFLADPESFHAVVGSRPVVVARKCARGYYKNALRQAVRAGGNPSLLGGIEFAEELADAMDLYRARKAVPSFGHLIDDLRRALRRLST